MKKLRAATAAAIALLTVGSLAACGTASSEDSDSGVTTIKFALETQDSPYSYADKDGNPTGFDLDVLKQLDKKLPIMQQDSNTTQATDRTKRDALSFGAKQIAIMTEVELIAGFLHCLC